MSDRGIRNILDHLKKVMPPIEFTMLKEDPGNYENEKNVQWINTSIQKPTFTG